MAKKIVIVVVVVLILVVACFGTLGYMALSSLDKVIESGIETVGPEITGTDVKVESVSISPMSGVAQIKGFIVGNPEGYKTEHAFKLGKVLVSIDIKSLATDVPHIRDFVIEGTQVTWEGSLRGSNLTKIQRHVESFVGTGEEEEEEDEKEQKVIIDHFLVKDTSVLLSMTMLQGKGKTLNLPDIELNDIGKAEGGATTKDIVGEVTPILFKHIAKVVATVGAGTAVGGPVGGAVAVPVTEGAKKAIDKAKDIGSNVKKSIGKLFGK
ncbi:MAG: hypothetical protein ACYTFY_09170 [Planctomycetota bacterium]|jgi:hypothetical protein